MYYVYFSATSNTEIENNTVLTKVMRCHQLVIYHPSAPLARLYHFNSTTFPELRVLQSRVTNLMT